MPRTRNRGKVVSTPLNVAKMLAKQHRERRDNLSRKFQKKRANKAKTGFKPGRRDRGKLFMVSGKGKRLKVTSGRKGYLVYVTKSGRKWLLKQRGKFPYKAERITRLPSGPKSLRRVRETFQEKRRVLVATGRTRAMGRPVNRGAGEIRGERELINRLTDALTRSLRGQESHRQFLLTILALVELPDKSKRVFRASVDISRRDHVTIKKGGVRNFVRQKVWGFLATELAFAGYVSGESDNHIRKLAVNRGKPRSQWKDKRDDRWAGADLEMARIISVEYKIEQLSR
jgi:hypothetical protein